MWSRQPLLVDNGTAHLYTKYNLVDRTCTLFYTFSTNIFAIVSQLKSTLTDIKWWNLNVCDFKQAASKHFIAFKLLNNESPTKWKSQKKYTEHFAVFRQLNCATTKVYIYISIHIYIIWTWIVFLLPVYAEI